MENSFQTPLKLYSIPFIVFKNVLDFFLGRISEVLAASETRKQLGILLFIVDQTYSENLIIESLHCGWVPTDAISLKLDGTVQVQRAG